MSQRSGAKKKNSSENQYLAPLLESRMSSGYYWEFQQKQKRLIPKIITAGDVFNFWYAG